MEASTILLVINSSFSYFFLILSLILIASCIHLKELIEDGDRLGYQITLPSGFWLDKFVALGITLFATLFFGYLSTLTL